MRVILSDVWTWPQNRRRLKLTKDQRLDPKEEVLSVEIARSLPARS